jgi:hypothetical protein
MRLTATTFVASLLLSASAFSQEQLGLRLETYAGVSSLAINPAGNLNNPLKWDANLVGGGVFIENNYVFLRETSLRRLLAHRNDASFVAAEDVEGPLSENTFVVDFFNDGAKRFVNTGGYVAGPSLALRLGEQHSVGVFTNLRFAVSAVNIPNAFSYYKYDAQPFDETFEVPKLQASALNWSEIGLNYAFKLPTADGSMNFGASLKFLQGYEAAYLDSRSTYQHTKQPGNIVTVGLPNGEYGYALSLDDPDGSLLERKGRGLGADLGFTYIFQEHEEGYKLKLGASLLDLGRIHFNNDAQYHRLNVDTTVTVDVDDYDQYTSPEDLQAMVQTLSQNSLKDPLATYEGNSFKMALPATLSLQADYGISEHFYVGALLMQRLPASNPTAKRGNLLAITPRWQHRWFSASVPVSVYNWSRAHVGFAARLGWLVIGSDDVLGAFSNKNLTGADFYFALKINPFEIGSGGGERGGGRRRFGGRGKVKCYTF